MGEDLSKNPRERRQTAESEPPKAHQLEDVSVQIDANTLSYPVGMYSARACVAVCREIGNSTALRPFVKRLAMPEGLKRNLKNSSETQPLDIYIRRVPPKWALAEGHELRERSSTRLLTGVFSVTDLSCHRGLISSRFHTLSNPTKVVEETV
jgi:hypothetical protein